jgi:hypothetical protein
MRRIAALFLLAFVVACSSATTSGGPRFGSDRNIITYEEIQASRNPGWTAWDLVSALRPHFLNSRGVNSLRPGVPSAPVVYLDGIRYGELPILRTLSVDNISAIQYLNAGDATTRYGTDNPAGAILIVTR